MKIILPSVIILVFTLLSPADITDGTPSVNAALPHAGAPVFDPYTVTHPVQPVSVPEPVYGSVLAAAALILLRRSKA